MQRESNLGLVSGRPGRGTWLVDGVGGRSEGDHSWLRYWGMGFRPGGEFGAGAGAGFGWRRCWVASVRAVGM